MTRNNGRYDQILHHKTLKNSTFYNVKFGIPVTDLIWYVRQARFPDARPFVR